MTEEKQRQTSLKLSYPSANFEPLELHDRHSRLWCGPLSAMVGSSWMLDKVSRDYSTRTGLVYSQIGVKGSDNFDGVTLRHSGGDERIGGKKSIKAHRGAMYQELPVMHKADSQCPSTLKK